MHVSVFYFRSQIKLVSECLNSYNQVIYTPVSNSVTGFFFDKSKLVIETYFVETEKFMLPIILKNTGMTRKFLTIHYASFSMLAKTWH